MAKKVYRQGDVVIEILGDEEIPESAKKAKDLILAYGEVTGHKHEVKDGVAIRFEDGDVQYLQVVSENAVVRHEEHKPITLPKGNFKIWIQEEYTPEAWNRVRD